MLSHLPQVGKDLAGGAIVTITHLRVRLRSLPIMTRADRPPPPCRYASSSSPRSTTVGVRSPTRSLHEPSPAG